MFYTIKHFNLNLFIHLHATPGVDGDGDQDDEDRGRKTKICQVVDNLGFKIQTVLVRQLKS